MGTAPGQTDDEVRSPPLYTHRNATARRHSAAQHTRHDDRHHDARHHRHRHHHHRHHHRHHHALTPPRPRPRPPPPPPHQAPEEESDDEASASASDLDRDGELEGRDLRNGSRNGSHNGLRDPLAGDLDLEDTSPAYTPPAGGVTWDTNLEPAGAVALNLDSARYGENFNNAFPPGPGVSTAGGTMVGSQTPLHTKSGTAGLSGSSGMISAGMSASGGVPCTWHPQRRHECEPEPSQRRYGLEVHGERGAVGGWHDERRQHARERLAGDGAPMSAAEVMVTTDA